MTKWLKKYFNYFSGYSKKMGKIKPKIVIIKSSQISITDQYFKMGNDKIEISKVYNVLYNKDTLRNNNQGGAISIATKEYSVKKGVFGVFHRAAFSDNAMVKVDKFVDQMKNNQKVRVKTREMPNKIFTASFV